MKVIKVGFITSLLALNVQAQFNGGVGHSTAMKGSPLSERGHVSFIDHNQDDFNGDNIPDRLICNHTKINNKHRINIRIINGKTNRDYFRWNWSEGATLKSNGNKLILTGCDVVYLRARRPSVILSTAFVHPSAGVRIRAPQLIIHNRPSDNRLQPKIIKIPGSSLNFSSAARSVKCTQVPHSLKVRGVKDGAYCFYAGYDSPLHSGAYGTVTAFVKFEQGAGDTFKVKDLTKEVNLPWSGGMKGTNWGPMRDVRLCSGSYKKDGLHMMGGAFVDYNRDGLKDLITVGQHASIRSHKMVLHSGKSEKFYFSNSMISDVHNGGMSEFLRIISLDENEANANSSCVYISGEKYNGCGSVPDHLRCFRNGKWETSFPAGSRFSSTMAPVTVKANGRGKYVIKATEIASNGKKVRDRFYGLSGAFDRKILLSVNSRVQRTKAHIIVKGWACVRNTRWRPRITISNKSHHTQSGYRKYYQSLVHINAEPMLKKMCLQPDTFPLRFQANIPKSRLTSQKGKLYIQADFYHTNSINLAHVKKTINY